MDEGGRRPDALRKSGSGQSERRPSRAQPKKQPMLHASHTKWAVFSIFYREICMPRKRSAAARLVQLGLQQGDLLLKRGDVRLGIRVRLLEIALRLLQKGVALRFGFL